MEHPRAVLEKAQRLEQLLRRVAAGEPLAELNAELGFDLDEAGLAQQQAKYAAGGHTWTALIDGRHGHPRKAHSALREWLYARKKEDDSLRAPQLVKEIQDQFGVTLHAGHVNYLLRQRGLTAPPGRPFKQQSPAAVESPGAAVDHAGLFFPGRRQD
jgi:transposase